MLCPTVVEAIGDIEGWTASELEFSLYDYLDPVVLDRLENQANDDWELDVTVGGHDVLVGGDGLLSVDGREFTWSSR
jgi:hypothetical protein